MINYKEMYLTMVRESERALRALDGAQQALICAQQACEELYLSSEDTLEASPSDGGTDCPPASSPI